MKIVPNTKQPNIGSLLEFQDDGKKYVIGREGIDDVWILRDGGGISCIMYKHDLITALLKHEVKILN